MTLLAAIALAEAAPVQVQVTGLGRSKAASVVLRGEGVQVGACQDDGRGADAAPDGVWTCSVEGVGEADVGLLRDGELLQAGSSSAGLIWLELSKGRVVLHEQAAPAGQAVAPRVPGTTLLVRLAGLVQAVPPVLQLSGEGGTVELSCHDDGSFPELAANDGVFGCGGLLPVETVSASLTVKPAGGDPIPLGEVSWGDGLVRYLDADVAGVLGTASFPLSTEAAPVEAPRAVTSSGPRGAAPPLGAVEAERLPTEPGGYRWGGLVVGSLLGVGLGIAFGRRRRGVPSGLEPVEAALLAPGGPRPSGDPVAVVGGGLEELLGQLALVRRVVVVTEGSEVPEVAGHPVFRAASCDRLEIERAVRELGRTAGAPVALVVQGRHTVVDPGALSADPTGTLLAGLEGWAVLLLGPDEKPPAGVALWRLEDGAWSRG